MNCRICGHELKNTDKFCPECGTKIIKLETKTKKKDAVIVKEKTNKTKNEEKQYVNGINNDTALCIASLICAYGLPIVGKILEWFGHLLYPIRWIFGLATGLLWLLSLAALPLAIYARIKYPESTFAKVLIIIYVIQLILGILFVLLIFVTCGAILESCGSLGLLWL